MSTSGTSSRIVIRGDGIVGCCAALALGSLGLPVRLEQWPASLDPLEVVDGDVRTYALNVASRHLLQRLRVWDALPAGAVCPVLDMHIQGDGLRDAQARGAAPAGVLRFSAWQQGLEALAWIVDAAALEQALRAAVRFSPHVRLGTAGPTLDRSAELLLLCEGRDSQGRQALGVEVERQAYGHQALATRVVADQPHAGVASQWFGQPDVLALLPFDSPQRGFSYGVVWSQPAQEAQRWSQASTEAFEDGLQQATGGACGRLRLSGPRRTWPLVLSRARRITGPGWALLGDCAHTVHPLAGQGLNLGLADVASLCEVLAERETWRSLGDEKLLARHERRRLSATLAMSGVTDGLWQLFSQTHPAVRELRNRGMSLLNHLSLIKKQLVRRALG